jgi:hypothetical protein
MLSGCSKGKPNVDTSKIDALAQKLLSSISQDKAAEFYKQSFAQSFKDRVSEKDWEVMADRYRTHLGAMVEMDRYSTRLNETEYSVEASCTYSVKWEKDDGKLELSLSKEDGMDWKVVSMSISSKKISELAKTSDSDNLDAYKKEAESMTPKKKPDISPSAPSIPTGDEK